APTGGRGPWTRASAREAGDQAVRELISGARRGGGGGDADARARILPRAPRRADLEGGDDDERDEQHDDRDQREPAHGARLAGAVQAQATGAKRRSQNSRLRTRMSCSASSSCNHGRRSSSIDTD